MNSPDGDPPSTGPASGAGSLFGRMGGTPPLRTALDDFYRGILLDPVLAPYFDGADVEMIKRHQLDLFTQLLGGPARYPVDQLAAAHQPLHIPVEHYQLVVGHLVATLVGMGIPDDVFAAIGQLAADVQADIVFLPGDTPQTPRQGAQTRG